MRAAQEQRVYTLVEQLRMATRGCVLPAVTLVAEKFGRDPFLVLVSCLLSLRTKDTVSWPASCRLFSCAKTVHELREMPAQEIERAIYPVLYYKRKAAQLPLICDLIIKKFGGQVPSGEKELLSLPGVGRKTMNLVRGEGFGIPALCVDVHVHRISNRLGLVSTQTPEETEYALMKILPPELWVEWNKLLVMWGQNVCVPISPWCSKCPVAPLCERIGVVKNR